jgi:hypothetical protein
MIPWWSFAIIISIVIFIVGAAIIISVVTLKEYLKIDKGVLK